MGREPLDRSGVPNDMDGPVGEYPAGINDIVGARIFPAVGVKNDAGFREIVNSKGFRMLLADLLRKGIHGEPILEKPNQITIFTSRNKAALATIAAATVVTGTAYALHRRRQRNKST